MTDNDTWREWSKHVLKELTRLNDNMALLHNKIETYNSEYKKQLEDIKIKMAIQNNTMKYKIGLMSMIATAIPVVIALLLRHFKI